MWKWVVNFRVCVCVCVCIQIRLYTSSVISLCLGTALVSASLCVRDVFLTLKNLNLNLLKLSLFILCWKYDNLKWQENASYHLRLCNSIFYACISSSCFGHCVYPYPHMQWQNIILIWSLYFVPCFAGITLKETWC